MVTQRKIAFAVVGNKLLPETKKCLESINKQDLPAGCSLSVFFVESPISRQIKSLKPSENIEYFEIAKKIEESGSGAEDLAALAGEISDDHEWIWIINAEDRLHSQRSLQTVVSTLNNDILNFDGTTCIFLCGANKSLDTNLQHKGSLRDLCETFGFSQLLGAGDTLLIRPSAFNVVFGSHFADAVQQATVSTETFWLAAKFLYLGLHNQRVLFLDSKVVNQTSRLPGWFSANDATALKESEMCFRLVKDFGELFKATQPIGGWNPNFFRVDQTLIWQHLVRCQSLYLSSQINGENGKKGEVDFELFVANWATIASISNMMNNRKLIDRINSLVTDASSYTIKLMLGNLENEEKLTRLFEQEKQSTPMFPTSVVQS